MTVARLSIIAVILLAASYASLAVAADNNVMPPTPAGQASQLDPKFILDAMNEVVAQRNNAMNDAAMAAARFKQQIEALTKQVDDLKKQVNDLKQKPAE